MKFLKRYAKYNRIVNRLNFLKSRFMCKPFQKVVIWNEYKAQSSNYTELVARETEGFCNWSTEVKLFVWLTPLYDINQIIINEWDGEPKVQVIKESWFPWKLDK